MRFSCRAVDASFFDNAPWIFKNTVELAAPSKKVFEVFEDSDSWPKWFDGIQQVVWKNPKPFGVGTTRTVWLTTLTIDEHFFRWEADRRFSFYLTSQSLPMVHALAEDYLLEPTPNGSRFTHTVAMEPRLPLRLTGPLGRAPFASMFSKAAASLVKYVAR